MVYIYKVHHLPLTDPILIPFLAGKFASLRLSALSSSPAAFSSTFDIESAFTAQAWIERLQRPLTHNFIAVAYSPATILEQQTISSGDWIGCVTLLGPIPKATYELSESGGLEIEEDDLETKWQITAVYNKPEHRGKGIAKMLIRSALDFAAKESGEGRRCRARIMIHPSNIAVKRLYAGIGFENAGLCTLAVAYLSSGDAMLLPPDGGLSQPEKYHNRLGTVMERVDS
jgi:ribosomal protein S18 acetylase RimI-like enzyme